MSDPAARVVVVAAIVVVALVVARLGPRLTAQHRVRGPLDLTGLEGSVLFFTDAACVSCDQVRRMLDAAGADYVEVEHRAGGGALQGAGVGAVPLVVVRDRSGNEIGRIGGVPGRWRLMRLLRRAGA